MVENLSKRYSGGKVALQATTVNLPGDKAIGIIGENGSGKSTFIKLLAGYLKPNSGKIVVNGLSPLQQLKKYRRHLGYLAQDTQLDPEMTGFESLSLFAAFYGIKKGIRKKHIEQLTAIYGLEDHLHKTIKQYSGGLRQRLHLAISMIHEPDFLMLDEPTNALDASGKKELWQQIRHRSEQGQLSLVVSHDLQDIERFCDYLLLFHNGEIVLKGPIQELVKKDNSYRLVYLVEGKMNVEQLQAKVSKLDGLRRIDCTRNQVVVSVDNGFGKLEDQIRSLIEQEGGQVIESRRRKTDLSTLYFNLTGQTGEPRRPNGGKGRKKKRYHR